MRTHSCKTENRFQCRPQCKSASGDKHGSLKTDPPALFQPSLAVGAPDDPFEQEAEKVSSQVMENYDQVTKLQRKLSCFDVHDSIQPMRIGTSISRKLQRTLFRNRLQKKGNEFGKEALHAKSDRIQFSGEEAVVPSQMESMIQNQRGGGRAMDPITQTAMESSFGADFSSVKIHTDSTAIQMSRALHAHAFTIGNDIFFNEGRYQPHTKAGAGLLAHELTHVVQQGAAVQNKTVSRLPFSNLFSNKTIAKLSSAGGDAAQQASLYRKEIAQFQKEIPESQMQMQQQQILQSKEVDKVQTQSNAKIMRLYGGGSSKKAKLKSGPTYSPNGALKATVASDGTKQSPNFTLSAEFEHDPSNGIVASCGEIRQMIKWSSDADRPNHSGFGSSYKANTWYEDRAAGDVLRLGHRTGTYAIATSSGSINKYVTAAGAVDMANGPIYSGSDQPMDGSGKKTGFWDFEFQAIDTCNGNAVLATDSIRLQW